MKNRIPVVYEDEFIIAFNKPPGLPSQQTRDPRREHLQGLAEAEQGRKFFLHHRLDRDTSGVVLFGKDPSCNLRLTEIFRNHLAEKTYSVIAIDNHSKFLETLAGDEFDVELHMAPVKTAKGIERMVVVKSGGWHSKTKFKIVDRAKGYLRILAHPETGRTHQIRVHLANLRLPILGDNMYGGKSSIVPRMMLHALELRIPHPKTGEVLNITAEEPSDISAVKSRLFHSKI